MFGKGDIVKIVDEGAVYPDHIEMAIRLKATKWKETKYNSRKFYRYNNKIGIIKNHGIDVSKGVTIYLIYIDSMDTEILIEGFGFIEASFQEIVRRVREIA